MLAPLAGVLEDGQLSHGPGRHEPLRLCHFHVVSNAEGPAEHGEGKEEEETKSKKVEG